MMRRFLCLLTACMMMMMSAAALADVSTRGAEEYSPEGLREANHTLKHFYLALEIAKRLIQ